MSEYPFDPDFLPYNLRHIKTEGGPSVGLPDGRMAALTYKEESCPFANTAIPRRVCFATNILNVQKEPKPD
jgi:hypothetical protein